MKKIPKIEFGSCSGCQKTLRLLDSACSDCRSIHGRYCGPIMARIRMNKKFAIMCYCALRGDYEREKFIEMFGDPRRYSIAR